MTADDTILAFDPGGTTGFAVVNRLRILYTAILDLDQIPGFCEWLETFDLDCTIGIEIGPHFGNHSPVTRRAEATLIDYFPEAERVQPSMWKPILKSKPFTGHYFRTLHERDAAHLAYYLARQLR